MTELPTIESRGALVGGRWHRDARASDFASRCPFDTRHVIGGFCSDHAWVDDAVHEARLAQRQWRRWPLDRRVAAVLAFGERLAARLETLATYITTEVGKPMVEARAEARLLRSKIVTTAALAPTELAPRAPDGVDGFYDLRPLGVFAVLGPFNLPLHISNGHIAPALVAGNAAILKPSDIAPACAELYARAWLESAAATGAPAGLLGLLQGGGDVGAALAAHEGIDAVAFTGSYEVGVAIRRATVHQTGKLLALEMGGKNAALVLSDADIEAAAADIAAAALSTSGQRCTATSRVIADVAVADELFAALARRLEDARVGDPRRLDVDLGPLATESARDRFCAAQAELAGCRPIVAGGRVEAETPGWWVRPAMHEVLDVGAARRRTGEELFGPELLVERVSGDSEAVIRANATRFGLAASVHTADSARFSAAREELDVGLVNWNRGTAGASGLLPFGGIGRSGNHRPAGAAAIRYCVRPVATLGFTPERPAGHAGSE